MAASKVFLRLATTSLRVRLVEHSSNVPRAAVVALLIWILFAAPRIFAQQSFDLDQFFRRGFLQQEFRPKSFGPARWMNRGEGYTTLESSTSFSGASELVRYDTTTGHREVLIAASDLIPSGSKDPLHIENYEWSADMSRALIYTNS